MSLTRHFARRRLSDDGTENTPYERAIEIVERRAKVEMNEYVAVPDDEKHWTFDFEENKLEHSAILQASIIKVILGNFREGWWSYKIIG